MVSDKVMLALAKREIEARHGLAACLVYSIWQVGVVSCKRTLRSKHLGRRGIEWPNELVFELRVPKSIQFLHKVVYTRSNICQKKEKNSNPPRILRDSLTSCPNHFHAMQ